MIMFRFVSWSNKKKTVNFPPGSIKKKSMLYLLSLFYELTRYICFKFISVSYYNAVLSVGKFFHPNGSR